MNMFSRFFAVALLVSSVAAFGTDDKNTEAGNVESKNEQCSTPATATAGVNDDAQKQQQQQQENPAPKVTVKPSYFAQASALPAAALKAVKKAGSKTLTFGSDVFVTGNKFKGKPAKDGKGAFINTLRRSRNIAAFVLPKAAVVAVAYYVYKTYKNNAADVKDEFEDEDEEDSVRA